MNNTECSTKPKGDYSLKNVILFDQTFTVEEEEKTDAIRSSKKGKMDVIDCVKGDSCNIDSTE